MPRTTPPPKAPNQDKRSREHLFPSEVAAMVSAAKRVGRRGHDTRAIQAYLGHRNIQHTVRYTELSSKRFQDFWLD